MLAQGGGAVQFFVVALVIIGIVVSQIAEYVRRTRARREAEERRLRQVSEETKEPEAARPKRASGGLAALLEVLDERAGGREEEEEKEWEERPPPFERQQTAAHPAPWLGPRAYAPEQSEGWRGRTEEAEAPVAPEAYEKVEAAPPALSRLKRELAATERREATLPVPEAAPVHAPPWESMMAAELSTSRQDARNGVLWSVVLSPPRALGPYGEPGAAEPPGGIV